MKRNLVLFAVILSLASCRTMTKTQDTHTVVGEFKTELKKDSTGKHEETVITETKTEEENKTVVEGEFEVDTAGGSGITAQDYEPVDGVTVESEEVPMITVDKDGSVTIKGKIKKFKVTGETKKTVTDSTAKNTKDTASVSTSGTTTIKTTDEQKHSTTHREGIVDTIFRHAFWPLLIVGIIYVIYIIWKRRKAKKGQEPPV